MRNDIPNPGSPEAVAQGCKCAVMDNHCGRGYRGQSGVFVVTASCPLHGNPQEAPDADAE